MANGYSAVSSTAGAVPDRSDGRQSFWFTSRSSFQPSHVFIALGWDGKIAGVIADMSGWNKFFPCQWLGSAFESGWGARSIGGSSEFPHVERSQLRWFWHLIRMPPGCLQNASWVPPAPADPELTGGIIYLIWPGNAWMSGVPCLACCHCGLIPDKREKIDGS